MSAVVTAAPVRSENVDTRVFWQPGRWMFWAYVAMVAYGIVGALDLLAVFDALPTWVLGAAVGSVVALGLLVLWVIRGLNVFRSIPSAVLTAAFVWGACVAVAVAVKANGHLFGFLPKVLGNVDAARWSAAIAGPTTEEWVKTAGVVAVVLIARRHIQRPIQGLILGAMCGLGFQLVENISYVGNATLSNPSSDALGAWLTIGLRSVAGLTSHWMYSAFCGLGVGYAMTRRDRSPAFRFLVALALVGLGWSAHFLWNSPLITQSLPPAAAVVGLLSKILLVGIAFFVVYRLAMRSEWDWFTAVMRSEPTGVIAEEEITALRTRRSRRKARKRVRRSSGRPAARLVKRLQRAQLELAGASIADAARASRRRDEVGDLRRAWADLTVGARG